MKRIKPGNYEGMVRAILWALMLLSIGFAVRGGVKMASSEQVEIAAERPCVIIDAGHGGKRISICRLPGSCRGFL